MLKFIHLSDLHCEARGKRNQKIEERLAYIAGAYPEHHLILTGDLVDDGLESQYKALKKMLTGFYLCAPGNHDYKLAGNIFRRHSAKLYDRYFGDGQFAGKNKPMVTRLYDIQSAVMLIALDSNLESRNPLKFARGKIGLFQRRALRKILAKAPDIPKILIMHHHLLCDNPLLYLVDAAKLMRIIYHKVDMVLFGHKHQGQVWIDMKHKPHYIMAADNMVDTETAQEITVDGKQITVKPILIKG